MAPNAISFTDIAAFCHLTKKRLDPWEVEVIEALDGVYLSEVSKRQTEQAEASTKKKK